MKNILIGVTLFGVMSSFASAKECTISNLSLLAKTDYAKRLVADELYLKGYSFDSSQENGLSLSLGIQVEGEPQERISIQGPTQKQVQGETQKRISMQGPTQKQVQGETQERISMQGPTHKQVQGETQERISMQGPTQKQVQGETQERISMQGPTQKQVQGETQERISIQGPTQKQVQGKTHTDKLVDLYNLNWRSKISSHIVLTNENGEDIFLSKVRVRSRNTEREVLNKLLELLPDCK